MLLRLAARHATPRAAFPFAALGALANVRWSSTQHSGVSVGDADNDFVELWGESEAAAAPALSPLGVVRLSVPADDEELSRLRIPIAHKRRGQPLPRDGSRAVQNHEPSEGEPDEREISEWEGGSEAEGGERQQAAASLPFDDERLAETILEMEVEGALDEAWQDTAKAHVEDVVALAQILRDLKVRDVCAIDVSNKTGNFDYLLIGTCEGPRHMHLASWAVQEADRHKRISKVKRQRTDELWEIVPVGRIVVNLMQQSYREEVNIERKWVVTRSMDPLQTANAPISEGRQVKAHGLWTLTLNLQDLEDFEVDYCKDVLMSQT
jgi:ribosomal silencing factor RsfS